MVKWASVRAFCAVGLLAGVMLTGCGGGGGGGGGGMAVALPTATNTGSNEGAGQVSGAGSTNGADRGSAGGTGGTNSGALGAQVNVVFSPAVVRVTLAKGDSPSATPGIQKLTATLTGAKVAGLYVFITAAEVLFPARQLLNDDGNGSYVSGLPIYFNRDLPAGIQKGTLQLQVCSDVDCSVEYGANGGSLPYEITVLPAPTISIAVNGAPVAGGTQPVALKDGDTVDLHSDVSVTWSTGSGGVMFSGESFTSTDWHSVIKYAINGHGSTATMNVNAVAAVDPSDPDGPLANTRVRFTLTE